MRKIEKAGKGIFMHFCLEDTMVIGTSSVSLPKVPNPPASGLRAASPNVAFSILEMAGAIKEPQELTNSKISLNKSEEHVNRNTLKDQLLRRIKNIEESLRDHQPDSRMYEFYD